ncbi:VanW family protein [Brevibacillus nitrificans]|nr:VanW family protein [Brevibacillus nitrificans]
MIKQILVKLPLVYKLRVLQLRIKRTSSNFFVKFPKERSVDQLPQVIKRHLSLLRRKLGASDPKLQENKITNLRIALQSMNGIIIKPGETFSFWHLIGKPTALQEGFTCVQIKNTCPSDLDIGASKVTADTYLQVKKPGNPCRARINRYFLPSRT